MQRVHNTHAVYRRALNMRRPLFFHLSILLFLLVSFTCGKVSYAQATATSFRRGDADNDGAVNLSDGIAILRFLFQTAEAPGCADAADTDDSGTLDLADVIYLFNFLFQGGPAPPKPFECGVDPTDDALDCRNYQPLDPALDCDGARNLAPAPGGGLSTSGPGSNFRWVEQCCSPRWDWQPSRRQERLEGRSVSACSSTWQSAPTAAPSASSPATRAAS